MDMESYQNNRHLFMYSDFQLSLNWVIIQRTLSRGMHHGIFHESLGNISVYTSAFWFHGRHATRDRCITILYTHDTIRRMVGRLGLVPSNIQRLSCIPIGCIFYGLVYKEIPCQRELKGGHLIWSQFLSWFYCKPYVRPNVESPNWNLCEFRGSGNWFFCTYLFGKVNPSWTNEQILLFLSAWRRAMLEVRPWHCLLEHVFQFYHWIKLFHYWTSFSTFIKGYFQVW